MFEGWKNAATYTHLGFTLAACVLLGFFGGWFIDGKINTKPLLAIIGAFLGAGGGFFNLIRTLNQIEQPKNNNDHNNDAS